MRARIMFLLSFFLLIATIAGSQSPYDLKFPPVNPVKTPAVDRIVLKNGMMLYLIEDHELPLISISARIGAGSIDEPADKVGLASLTGRVMRMGGTASLSGDQMDDKLESLAASVETGIGQTSGSASLSTLKENFDVVLPVFADVLMHPAFPQEKIELAKVQAKTGISRRNDDPDEIASREFDKLIYGSDSVYARQTEYLTIDSITRQDMVAFHQKYFYPNNVMMAVWGDFQTKDLVRKIEAAFKDWKKGPAVRPKPPGVDYKYESSVYFVRKEDVNQSTIALGHIGGMANNPDYFALLVLNDVLGAFSGRLFERVRSQQGLAYSVGGGYESNFEYPGEFYISASTKSESTVQAVQSMLHEIELLRKEEITEEELAVAKESFLNSFVFYFDTKSEVVNRIMRYDWYGYPRNFLEMTKEKVEKVTRADILRVAQKYLHPDQVKILVVGNDKEFGQPLSTLGNVHEIDVTIPQ